MEIIDLAEKQRNNELMPKHIRYENEDLYFDGVTYYDKEGNNDFFDIIALNNSALTHLFDKVEILDNEENGLPEKLKMLNANCLNDYESNYTKEAIALDITTLQNWINKLIDYLEKQRKGE